MFPEFAYSLWMQLILAAQTFITNTFIMYLIANLILKLSDVKASAKQKFVFAFWIGAVSYQLFIYAVYLIGGMASFSPIVYAMVVCPNPIQGCIYYFVGVRVLKLSPVRSIKFMAYFFAYFIFISNITRLVTALWPIETDPYNYLQNAMRQAVYLIIVCAVYFLTKYIIKKARLRVRLADKIFIDIRKERAVYVAKLVFLYALTTFLPIVINDNIAGSVIVILFLIFFIALNIVLDLLGAVKAESENKEVHINTLSGALNEFGAVKHDFYNILQSYNGYLELGDLDRLKKYHSSVISITKAAGDSVDLGRRMKENPAFISLLAGKAEYAESSGVKMTVALKCSAENLYIDDMDICRCIACLLDNAVEAAAVSEKKSVFFTLESKSDESKLIIVTNSTAEQVDISKISAAGVTSKQGHRGLGLPSVKKTLAKYGNCTFNMTYFNYEMSAYIELRNNAQAVAKK